MTEVAERTSQATGKPFRYVNVTLVLVTLSRSEGSVSLDIEMLRGVYPERSECAQHDRAALLPCNRHVRAFRLTHPFWSSQPLLNSLTPTAVDGLFLG